MLISVMSGAGPGPDATLDGLVARARALEAQGFAGLWMAHVFGLDAVGALAVAGRETERLALGTAVVPSPPRHPVALAQQALTTQVACRGRFQLGIGLSHRVVIEDILGLSYARPARQMREYLEVLAPLLRGEAVKFRGDLYRVEGGLEVPGAAPVPLLVAALGERMLRIAGQLADGTLTWMTGRRTLASHIVPRIGEAAREAGRPAPRIVAGLPVVLSDDPATARERIAKTLALYGTLPSYRAMLEREGGAGPGDVALVGDEAGLRAQLAELRDAGVTELAAAVSPSERGQRTLAFLADLRSELR